MSMHSVEQFWSKVGNDAELQRKVEGLFEQVDNKPVAKADAVVELARKNGFEFTKEELKVHFAARSNPELSEKELAAVAGGALNAYWKWEPITINLIPKVEGAILLF